MQEAVVVVKLSAFFALYLDDTSLNPADVQNFIQ